MTQLWGGSAFHCPFCHGWEMRDQPLAVLARGQRAVHSALLLRGWSDDIVVLTDGPDDMEDDDRARLAAADIAVDERSVVELASENGQLTAVVFADGTRLARTGVLVATTLHQRSTLADQLGADPAEPTPVAENPIAVDGFYRTTAPGSIRRRRPERADATGGGGDRERLTRGRRSGAESDGRRVWSGRS